MQNNLESNVLHFSPPIKWSPSIITVSLLTVWCLSQLFWDNSFPWDQVVKYNNTQCHLTWLPWQLTFDFLHWAMNNWCTIWYFSVHFVWVSFWSPMWYHQNIYSCIPLGIYTTGSFTRTGTHVNIKSSHNFHSSLSLFFFLPGP